MLNYSELQYFIKSNERFLHWQLHALAAIFLVFVRFTVPVPQVYATLAGMQSRINLLGKLGLTVHFVIVIGMVHSKQHQMNVNINYLTMQHAHLR